MSAVSRLDPGRPVRTGANLTPMIDMTFLLVVFFVLVSRITAVEQVPMELPVPIDPASGSPDEAPRIVVNLPGGEGGDAGVATLDQRAYQLDSPGLRALEIELRRRLTSSPELQVNLRADRRLQYATVSPVIDTIARSGNGAGRPDGVRVNLVVMNEKENGATP
ncbi:MAG: biopolymer transporter ExbD [Phycisphaerales bacterium]|nr:biopolymer transporter ExbD [Phycisphaerales bacterium]